MEIIFFIAVSILCASQFHPVSSLWGSGLRGEERPAAEISSGTEGQSPSVCYKSGTENEGSDSENRPIYVITELTGDYCFHCLLFAQTVPQYSSRR